MTTLDPVRDCVAVAALAAVVGLGAAGTAEARPSFVSHEATYQLRLADASGEAGIQDARGVMRYRFADTCDGWTSENAVAVEYIYDSGESLRSTWTFSSWEAKSGDRMRFVVTERANGHIVEQFTGKAEVDPAGKQGGTAVFKPANETGQMPEGDGRISIDLPAGTLLPTAHLFELFAAARDGRPIVSRTVFDGTTKDNPFTVNAIIGRGRDAIADIFPREDGVGDLVSYPMTLGFFQVRARNELPDFEMSIHYREDGIAEKVVQVFETFSIALTPDTIRYLEGPTC